MRTVEDSKQQLIRAGREYEAVLEALRSQQKDHLRLQTAIGVRESHANADNQRIISLPELPPLQEQEKRVADHLIAMTANLIDRPRRVAAYINKDTLVSLRAIKDRSQVFSPEKLTKELVDVYLGDAGHRLGASRAAAALEQHLGEFFRQGVTPYIDQIHKVKVGDSWQMDAVTSLRIADWLINLTAVLEAKGLHKLLADVDTWISAIESEGTLTVGRGAMMREDDHQIYLSVKPKRLMFYLSAPLVETIKSFLEESQHKARKGDSAPWFRML
ncbi:MAG: hypothetical protein GX771_01760 [Halomonadaceae bacterium]|nr:hypothetical protein [Halomonadaceae bacterium]